MPADKDLQMQIEHALRDLLPSQVSEGLRSILEGWLQKNLQKERSGWTERLQMAMKEIERERRQATEMYSQIDEINAKFAPFQHLIGQTREASVYASSDQDLKVYRLNQLNRSIDAMLKLTSGYANSDVMDTNELLSVTTQDGPESARSTDDVKVIALQHKLAMLRQKVEEQVREFDEMDEQRRDEIKHLGNTINTQNEQAQIQKKKYEQQIEDLKGIVKSQRVKLRQKGRHEHSTSMADKGVNVSIKLPRRHVCTQVDENTIVRAKLGLLNQKEEEQKKAVSAPDHNNNNGVPKSEIWDINTPMITPWNNHTSKLRKTKSCFASDFKLLKSVAIANDVISSQHSLVQQWLSTSPGLIQRENVDNLRSQVVDFAKKLEKARLDMDICQQQMALMQLPPVDDVSRSSEVERELKRIETNGGRETPTKIQNGVQGDLVRRKGGANRDLVLKLKSIQTKQNEAATFVYKPPKIKAKCLRCHQTYVCKEVKAQCRYHPKTKRKIEKYDAKDKMIKMIYLWECCLQPSDAQGCCVGEHI